jgi:hypothetical protein
MLTAQVGIGIINGNLILCFIGASNESNDPVSPVRLFLQSLPSVTSTPNSRNTKLVLYTIPALKLRHNAS